jgi:hypothetical protein
MMAIGTSIALAVGTIILILHFTNFGLTPDERRNLKDSLENFWVAIARLEMPEQFQHALAGRYAKMKRVRRQFVYLFWFISLVLTTSVSIRGLFSISADTLFGAFLEAALGNLGLRRNLLFQWTIANPDNVEYFTVRATDCVRNPVSDWLTPLTNLNVLEEKYIATLQSLLADHPLLLKATGALATVIVGLTLALILSLALYISFNLTLWLLSKSVTSKVKLLAMLVLTFVIAIIMPPLLISTLMQCFWFSAVFTGGGIIDFATFPDPNWFTIALAMTSILLFIAQPLAAVYAQVTYLLPFWGKVFIFAFSGWSIVGMTYFRILSFFTDLWKTLHINYFDIPITNALVNWSIFIDLLFSLTYLLPCFALIAVHHNIRARRMLLDFVQLLSEHPRGPLIAFAETLLSAFRRKRDE